MTKMEQLSSSKAKVVTLLPQNFQHLITSISYELVGQVGVCEKRKGKTSKSFMQKIGISLYNTTTSIDSCDAVAKCKHSTRERFNMVNNEVKRGCSHTLKVVD